MSGPQRPRWVRLDVDWMDNPKVAGLHDRGRPDAIVAWLDGLSYAAAHLTDGWLPTWFPARRGHKPRTVETLVQQQLWHPLEISDQGGWVINDYLDYQPSKDWWERQAAQRRAAARSRWGG